MAITSNYPRTFRVYIKKSVQFSLSKIQQADILSNSDREQALYILSYALKIPEAWSDTYKLLLAMASQMERSGFSDEWLSYLKYGISQSQLQGDARAEAELYFQSGLFFQLRGNYPKAESAFKKAAVQYKNLKDFPNQARALNKLAYVARQQRQFDEAFEQVQQALTLLPTEHTERAYSYLVLGVIELDKRNWQQAANFFRQSLDLWQKEKNHRLMAWSLTNLGAALRPQGKSEEAVIAYEQAVSLLEKIHDPVSLAGVQMNLGNVYLTQGKPRQALELYLSTLPVFEQTQDTRRLALVYLNTGIANCRLKNYQQSKTAFNASIKYWQELNDVTGLVNTLDELGMLYLKFGQPRQAQKVFRQALNELIAIEDDPIYEYLLNAIKRHRQQANINPE